MDWVPPIPVVCIPIDAAKSAAPNDNACNRELDEAISLTLTNPAAVSIIASKFILLEIIFEDSILDTKASTA